MPGMEGLTNLLQNRLFLQYLSAAGSSMSEGKQIAPALNQVTQQNIAAQSYAKLLGRMLSGDVPQDGKVVMDQKGLNLIIPKTHMPKMNATGTSMEMGATNDPDGQLNTQQNLIREQVLNPSSSQVGVSGSDLAGLSTADIANIVSGAVNVKEFDRKKITDQVDMFYKLAQAKKALEGDPLNQIYPIEVPGVGKVSLRQWQSLPDKQKQYAAYVNIAKQLGDADVLPFDKFINEFDKTDREKFLRAAMADPKLMTAAEELAKAGRTYIDQSTKIDTAVKTATAKQKALNKLKGQTYFSNPEWVDDVGKHMSSEEVQQKIFDAGDKGARTAAEERIKYIQAKIKGGGGKIVNVKYSKDDNRVMIWTIEWPDGSRETKEYAVWD